MRKKLTAYITMIAMCAAIVPQLFSGSVQADEVWMPNPIKVREKLDRGLVAMQTEEGIYLTWRLQADEDSVYGTGSGNVSFDIYRDGEKIATEGYTTNYIDKDGTANSEYQVVRSGVKPSEDKMSNKAAPFSSGKNYFDIELDVPAPVSFPSDVTEDDAAEEETEEGSTETGEEEDVDTQTAEGKHAYTVGDTSVGDLDGDGEYELVVKWDCSPKDNSHGGYTGNVILSAYKLDGEHMWDIDLGPNIRAGAHYTQFLVYDFDGDGKAEITAKTAPGSKGGDGEYVSKAAKSDEDIRTLTDEENEESYVTNYGRIVTGDEYFTIFDGETGAALDTIYYPNQRLAPSIWGDSDTYANRAERFTAAVAYLDGKVPYAVYMRGYYYGYGGQRQAACAVSYNGEKLDCHLSFDSYDVNKYKDPSGYTTSAFYKKPYSARNYKGVIGYEEKYKEYVAQGNHNCTVADVDGDGRDEVLTGAMCYHIDDNGNLRPLWTTFKGHGDALHIGDYDPTHDGYEFFVVHEEGGGHYDHGTLLDYGMSVIDPGVPTYNETGAAPENIIMYHNAHSGDTGRGMMANVGAGGYYQFWGAGTRMSAGGGDFRNSVIPSASSNFRIYWDGDLYEELLDGVGIRAWNENKLEMDVIFRAEDCTSVNGTKSVPALSADILGDWREEVIFPTTDNTRLRVYTTDIYTEHKMKSLMYDSVYRCGVAAEQTGYNQPPHIGYYLDPGDNGEGKVDDAPKVTIPDTADVILHQDAEKSNISSYYNSLPSDIEGVNVNIGGGADKKSKYKYFAVMNQGLNHKVFKMQNGEYAYNNRAVTMSFTDEVKSAVSAALAEGKYSELTFAFKIFDGTNDTKGGLYLLENTAGNSKNTDYANKICTVSTTALKEGKWAVARYEFTGSGYSLYLDDELIASGTADTSLPVIAMPFTNTNGYDAYTSMIIDDIYVYAVEPGSAPTPAPTAEPEPTARPFGAAPVKTDSVVTEDFEQETNIFSDTAKVKTDPASKGKNTTNVFVTGGKQSATSQRINSDKTRTYVSLDFRIEPPQGSKTSALVLRNENKEDIINITAAAASSGFWGTCTINGIDITSDIKVSDKAYSGWDRHDSTGWIKMYAALDFEKNTADVSLIRISDNSVVYSGTLNFLHESDSLEYIYMSIPNAYGQIWLDNIDISADPDASVTGLTITLPQKTAYFTGEEFDSEGLAVTVNYSDDSSYELTPFEYDVSEPDMSAEGEKTITVTYGETTETFNIQVSDRKMTELSIVSAPSKTRYAVGGSLDKSGLVLRADYNDGSYEIVTDGFELSGFTSNAVGEKTVTASYGGKTAEFTVNVVNEDELNPTPSPVPTARPTPTPRPEPTLDPNEPEQTGETKNEIYALDVTQLSSGNVTVMVTSTSDRGNADVTDFGSGTDNTAAVSALDGWGYRHATFNGAVVSDKGAPYRQTAANVQSAENAFYAVGDGTCSGGTISFIPTNKDDLSLRDDRVYIYEFDAVATTVAQGKAAAMPVGFTSSEDGSTISSVDSVALTSTGVNNQSKTYKMVLVYDKPNGEYYIYQDGILQKNGNSDAITGVYAQTVNKYAKIGFKDLKLYEQTKTPAAVKVVFNGDNGKSLAEYPSVLSGTLLEAPETPIVSGKTFREWHDADGAAVTEFAAGYKTTVYNAYYEDGSTIANVNVYADRFSKITLEHPTEGEKVAYTDIYGIAKFENIGQETYPYTVEKTGYKSDTGSFTLGADELDFEDELILDNDHSGYLYYEADWSGGAGYITDGSANSFSTELGPVTVKLPKENKVAQVFDVEAKVKAKNLTASGAAATWLLNSDEGALLGLHWAQGDGIYAITGWSGSSTLKNSTDTLEKAENRLKIASSDKIAEEITVNFAVDSVSSTIVVSANGTVIGSLPMSVGASELKTMSAGVTNSSDDIYLYTLAVTKPEDTYMAIAGDSEVAKISGTDVTRQYERSEAKVTEGETFTWSLKAPDGAPDGTVTIDRNGLLTIKDTALAGTYTIKCVSTSNSSKTAELDVDIKGFQKFALTAEGQGICDFRDTREIKYTLTSAVDSTDTDVIDKIPAPVWSVSDTSVADIDASTGILTMKKPGTVTVTATVMNGSVKSTVQKEVQIVNYYIIADAAGNSAAIDISSLPADNVTAYRVTTATASGTEIKSYTVNKEDITNNTLTIDTTGADKIEVAPVFVITSGIAYDDERYTLNVPKDTYDISVTASGQRVDVYANSQMLVNNMLQHGSASATETRRDIKKSEDYITIKTGDYASENVNASWTKITNITVVKSPSVVTRRPKMYVLGDSLVAKYYNGGSAENGLARSGWGQVLDNYITDDIDVVPLGNSGVTAKGLYGTAFTQIRESAAEGDYLILESGYNDKSYNTKAEMHDAISGMYNEATEKGVKVILVSPNASYHDYKGSVAWTSYMEEFANELGADYINLSRMSYDFLFDTYGNDFSQYYEYYNVDDQLHSTYNGAQKWASVVAQGIYDLGYTDIVNTKYKYEFSDGKNTITVKVIPNEPDKAELTAPKGKSALVYTGEIQELIETEATATGGTIEYSADGTNWFGDIKEITAVDAGDYTVYYRAKGNEEVADSDIESITVTIDKAQISAPEGLSSSAASSDTAADGSITGASDSMEYRLKGGSYTDVKGAEITGLTAGDYEVRYKGDENHYDSAAAEVSVNFSLGGSITWNYDYSYSLSNGTTQTGTVDDTPSQRSKTARVDLLNRGTVYKTATETAEVNGSRASAEYSFSDLPVSIDGAETSYSVKITPLVAGSDSDTAQTKEASTYSVTFTDSANRSADINYNPNCFDATWTVNIGAVNTVAKAVPDTVYVKVLYGTDADGVEGGQYGGYAVITQQASGNGTACALNDNGDGTYTASGKYPVWKYQPDGDSYFHKAIVTGYTVNGTYIDCIGKSYIYKDYMLHDDNTDEADKDMVITIENLDVPVAVFDANGGSLGNEYILNASYGAAVSADEVSAKVPVWDNHVFQGWYSAKKGGDAVTEINALNGKTTLYAHWLTQTDNAVISIGEAEYNGGAVDIDMAVTIDGKTLDENTDYDVTITEKGEATSVTPVNAGDYTVTVTGKNGYTGSASKDFTISKLAVTVAANSQTVELRESISDNVSNATLTGAAEGHKLQSISLTSTRTAAVTESGAITAKNAVITDNSGNDVTKNYDITYIDGILTVTKGTPETQSLPAAAEITYGEKLSDSALTGGAMVYGGANVPGTFEWVNGDIAPEIADSGRAEYDVLFTPTDTENFNSVTVKVRVTVNKLSVAAPEGVTATAASSRTSGDGSISGVTEDMEYRLKGGGYISVTGTEITGLNAGDYEVRYKGDDSHEPSEPVIVSVNFSLGGEITWKYAYSYYTSDGTEQSGIVDDTPTQRSKTAQIDLLNRGEVVDTVTVTAEVSGSTASAEYTFTDVPVSVDGNEASYSVKVTPLVADNDSDTEQIKNAESYSVVFTDADNRNADINYNPNCFDATWTVRIEDVDSIEDAVPDTVYVKVLYGTSAEGVEGGQYEGYAVITQQTNGNGTACALRQGSDGTYTASGSYPVWKYQPDGDSYYHKAIVTGYTVNGRYIDCTEKGYIYRNYMLRDSGTDSADRDMVIVIDKLDVPVVVFDANGGSMENGYVLAASYSAEITADEINSKIPERENYRFIGWYDAAEGGRKVDGIASLDGKTTIYAHWLRDIDSTIVSVGALEYTGSALTPEIKVTDGGSTLSENTDYTVSFTDKDGNKVIAPVNAGSYTVTLTGGNDYIGEASMDFTVAKRGAKVTAKPQTVGLGKSISTDVDSVILTDGIEGHGISSVTLSAPQTDSVTDSGVIEVQNAAIADSAGNDVTANYDIMYINGVMTVTKGTPSAETLPSASALMFGGKLSDSALAGGVMKYEGETVSGTFAWVDGDTVPQLSDSNSTEYDVRFTPTDGENYDGVTVKVKVTVTEPEKQAPSVTVVDNAVKAETSFGQDGGIVLTVSQVPDDVDTLTLIKAIYGSDKSLVSLTRTSHEVASDGTVSITLDEPQTENGETYKLMLWDGEQTPIINVINSSDNFFD